jgi:hypothetical protein
MGDAIDTSRRSQGVELYTPTAVLLQRGTEREGIRVVNTERVADGREGVSNAQSENQERRRQKWGTRKEKSIKECCRVHLSRQLWNVEPKAETYQLTQA